MRQNRKIRLFWDKNHLHRQYLFVNSVSEIMVKQPEMDASVALETAFSHAYAQHGRMVFNTCQRILGNNQAAEDATQAAFLVLLAKKHMLDNSGELGGWLHRVAVLSARAQRRAETRRMRHEQNAIPPSTTDNANWLAVRETLDAALDRLPTREREVLVLVYLEGFSYEQAAAALNLSLGTVASRAGRGLQRLREHLGSHSDEKALGALMLAMGNEMPLSGSLSQTLSVKTAGGKAAAEVSKEVLRNMLIGKIKIAGGTIAAVLLLVAGAAYVSYSEENAPAKAITAQKEDGWGAAVNGLSARIRLDRNILAPGKRLEAEVLLRNTSDKPLSLQLSNQPMLGWDVKDSSGKSVPAAGLKDVKPDPTIVNGRVEIQPGQTILWLARSLEAFFNFSADGEYTVQFNYELKDAGLWNGNISTATKLKVDPDAKNFAVETRSRDVPLMATGAEIRMASMDGDSSAYAGQVAHLLRGAKIGGRLRISHQAKDGWVLLPVAPLTAKDVAAGDRVRIEEEGYIWLRSFEPQSPGEPMNGLKATVSANKNKIRHGDAWKILGEIVNASDAPLRLGGLQNVLNLRYKDAPSPSITMCIGSGLRFDSPPPVINLDRQKKRPLLEIEGKGPAIHGSIGNAMLGLELKSGIYEVSVICRLSAEQACQERLKNVWLGSVESESIKIEITQAADGF